MLTTTGLSYLEAYGRDISRATTRVASMGKHSHIVHDMGVQDYILKNLSSIKEVVWDKNILFVDAGARPDALIKREVGADIFWAAVEYERWRKDTKRIYSSFVSHRDGFTEGHYAGVYYLFDSPADRKYYKALFDAESWPVYKRASRTSRLNLASQDFMPDSIKNFRKRFLFVDA